MKLRLIATAFLALFASTVRAAPGAAALNSSVVHLTTEESDGTGFVVGADDQTIFIVTAEHVVPNDAAGLRVQFNGAQYRSLAGRVFRRSVEADLAIVLVDVAADDSIRRSLKPLAYRSGHVPMLTTVSNIAIAEDRWFSNFEVNKLQDVELNVFGFSKSGVTQGASGGPLFDDGYRLIGMVTAVGGVKAVALKIDAILSLLSSWGVLVNLLEVWRPDCKIAIASVPSGAMVTADGSEAGVTPLSVRLVAGKRISVTLAKVGYTTETQQIDCTSADLIVALVKTPVRFAGRSTTNAPPKITITDERGRGVAALVRVAQRIEAGGYTAAGKLTEDSEKSTEFADLITVHMSLDVTVRSAGGAVAAHILLNSHGGGFRQDVARAQALERLVAAFDERLAQEVP